MNARGFTWTVLAIYIYGPRSSQSSTKVDDCPQCTVLICPYGATKDPRQCCFLCAKVTVGRPYPPIALSYGVDDSSGSDVAIPNELDNCVDPVDIPPHGQKTDRAHPDGGPDGKAPPHRYEERKNRREQWAKKTQHALKDDIKIIEFTKRVLESSEKSSYVEARNVTAAAEQYQRRHVCDGPKVASTKRDTDESQDGEDISIVALKHESEPREDGAREKELTGTPGKNAAHPPRQELRTFNHEGHEVFRRSLGSNIDAGLNKLASSVQTLAGNAMKSLASSGMVDWTFDGEAKMMGKTFQDAVNASRRKDKTDYADRTVKGVMKLRESALVDSETGGRLAKAGGVAAQTVFGMLGGRREKVVESQTADDAIFKPGDKTSSIVGWFGQGLQKMSLKRKLAGKYSKQGVLSMTSGIGLVGSGMKIAAESSLKDVIGNLTSGTLGTVGDNLKQLSDSQVVRNSMNVVGQLAKEGITSTGGYLKSVSREPKKEAFNYLGHAVKKGIGTSGDIIRRIAESEKADDVVGFSESLTSRGVKMGGEALGRLAESNVPQRAVQTGVSMVKNAFGKTGDFFQKVKTKGIFKGVGMLASSFVSVTGDSLIGTQDYSGGKNKMEEPYFRDQNRKEVSHVLVQEAVEPSHSSETDPILEYGSQPTDYNEPHHPEKREVGEPNNWSDTLEGSSEGDNDAPADSTQKSYEQGGSAKDIGTTKLQPSKGQRNDVTSLGVTDNKESVIQDYTVFQFDDGPQQVLEAQVPKNNINEGYYVRQSGKSDYAQSSTQYTPDQQPQYSYAPPSKTVYGQYGLKGQNTNSQYGVQGQNTNYQYGVQGQNTIGQEQNNNYQHGVKEQNTIGQYFVQEQNTNGQYGAQGQNNNGQYGEQRQNINDQYGVQGQNTNGQYGAQGLNNNGQYGVQGQNTNGKYGVQGQNTNGQYGAQGQNNNGQYGAQGQNTNGQNGAQEQNTNGQNGAQGQNTNGQNGAQGQNTNGQNGAQEQNTNGQNGAQGQNTNSQYGAQGQNTNGQYGAQGQNTNGQYGVQGQNTNGQYGAQRQNTNSQYSAQGQNTNDQYGVQGQNTNGQYGAQGQNTNDQYGVQGQNTNGQYGAQGLNNNGQYGVQGQNTNGQYGVQGQNTNGQYGVQGQNTNGKYGAQGQNNNGQYRAQGQNNNGQYGVQGLNNNGQYGVQGLNNNGQYGAQGLNSNEQYGAQRQNTNSQYGAQAQNTNSQYVTQGQNTNSQYVAQGQNTNGQYGVQGQNTNGQYGEQGQNINDQYGVQGQNTNDQFKLQVQNSNIQYATSRQNYESGQLAGAQPYNLDVTTGPVNAMENSIEDTNTTEHNLNPAGSSFLKEIMRKTVSLPINMAKRTLKTGVVLLGPVAIRAVMKAAAIVNSIGNIGNRMAPKGDITVGIDIPVKKHTKREKEAGTGTSHCLRNNPWALH